VRAQAGEGGNPVLSSSSMFLEMFSDVDIWCSYLLKIGNSLENNRARQICPKTASISSYQGKLACQSMVGCLNKNENR